MPEGHLVSAPPLCPPCSAPQGQAESGGMVLVAYAGPVRPAAALRDSVLCLPTDIHSLFVNKPSSSSSSSSSFSWCSLTPPPPFLSLFVPTRETMSLALFITDVSKHLSTSRYMSTSASAFQLSRYSMTMVHFKC